MTRARILLSLVIGLPLVVTRPASAQWSGPATMQYGMGLGPISMMVGNLSLGRENFASVVRQNDEKTRKAQQASLSFTQSPAVAAEFKSKFVDNVVKQAPAQEEAVRSQFAKIDIDDAFAKALRGQGLSPTNLADVMAVNVAIAWKVVNGAPDPSSKAMHAISQQLAEKLSGNPAVTKASDHDKQMMAETLAYQTVLAESAETAARTNSNTTALASVRQKLIANYQGMNVDLTALRLTDTGFAAK